MDASRKSSAEGDATSPPGPAGPAAHKAPAAAMARTAANALEILNALADIGSGTAVKLAEHLSLNRTVVHRLLVTLEAYGFVHAEGSSYRLGFALLRLADAVEFDVRAASRVELARLAQQAGESSVLAVRDGLQFVQVDQRFPNSSSEPQIRYPTGFRSSLLSSGHGRAIVAFSPDNVVDQCLAQIESEQREHYVTLISHVRQQGYAESSDELRSGVSGIAVPILNPNGDAIASIGYVCPTSRFPAVEKLLPLVQAAARRIEVRLFD